MSATSQGEAAANSRSGRLLSCSSKAAILAVVFIPLSGSILSILKDLAIRCALAYVDENISGLHQSSMTSVKPADSTQPTKDVQNEILVVAAALTMMDEPSYKLHIPLLAIQAN